MNYFYITGTSSGIGKAMAELLLKSEQNVVFGISRRQTIRHNQYHHFPVDLNEHLAHFQFPVHADAELIVLINNAGMLGPVKPAGSIDHQELKRVIRINYTAPMILIDKFIKTYQDQSCRKIIINVSSGAGRHPFPSWSVYCSSKAALDMATRVIAEEQKNRQHPVHAFAVAPGIVDTAMQDEIRTASPDDFPLHKLFVDYKEKNQLWPPSRSAEAILSICSRPDAFSDVLLDVRNL